MKVHETRSKSHASADEEGRMVTRSRNKKPKTNDNEESSQKSTKDIASEFAEFCKGVRNHLSIEEMRKILEANDADSAGPDDDVITRTEDIMFYGPLGRCPLCKGFFEFSVNRYVCKGSFSDWSKCPISTNDPPRNGNSVEIPEGIGDDHVREWIKNRTEYPKRVLADEKPLKDLMICLSGRLSRRYDYWREKIHKCGGKVSNTSRGVTCLVVPAGESGGSNKTAEALETGVPIVSEQWLIDSTESEEAKPLADYDMKPYLVPAAQGISWDAPDPVDEALQSLVGELKLYGKRGVYKDSCLDKGGGFVFEKDGIIYNCAFTLCDQVAGLNQYCIMQLIMLPNNHLHLYYKKSRVGTDPKAEERVEDFEDRTETAISEFVRLFEEITGNEFEPWKREKKFTKKPSKFFPLDMGDGFDVRYGGLSARKLGSAGLHCKLDPLVSSLVKILCSQAIYRYALMELTHDVLDLPVGMLSIVHLKRCEEELVKFREKLESVPELEMEKNAIWTEFSNKWFTLMPSSMPFIINSHEELADYVAAGYETIKDINVASRIIGDLTGPTVDDPLSDCYAKMGCEINPLEKESDDYKMIVKYLETTYEPVKLDGVEYGVSVENIFEVQSNPNESVSYDQIKNLPNKILLWCGTRSSNIVRHLNKGFQPAVCQIPAPGYMFGQAIVCSDASADAARYGFTGVDRPEGFLILAVASLGENITEISNFPEDVKELEEKKNGVKCVGKKKTEETEHFVWRDDMKVPCGKLVPSGKKDSPLEYNQYAVYYPKQVCMKFMVWVKYEEKNLEVDVPDRPAET
ncbi:hypothetical protein LUZ60_004138 [Juncus effusus]|nr:hypothetical protein LUZ60_004138 [Juncus effusus]